VRRSYDEGVPRERIRGHPFVVSAAGPP
jgi:hypothetical protein